ncbi:hypothetical protein HN51_064681 [Arachis hypogaea]
MGHARFTRDTENPPSVYIVRPETTILTENSSWTIRPYARKDDAEATSIPAVIFSTSGYIGKHFHEFTDIIIPLFLTSRQFNGQVKFVVSEMRPWWISKYQAILSKLSNYEVLNIDKVDQVHCFTGVNVGLKREEGEDENNKNKKQQPRLLILSRRRTRSFTNTAEIAKMARSMGFEAIVMEAGGSMSSFANVVNSCDVLLGVHGAGLTNIVFLPENAVLIQVVWFRMAC